MKINRKIMIIGITIILSLTIISCKNVLEVRRIDNLSPAVEEQPSSAVEGQASTNSTNIGKKASSVAEKESSSNIEEQSSQDINEGNDKNTKNTEKVKDTEDTSKSKEQQEQKMKDTDTKNMENEVNEEGSEVSSEQIINKNNKSVLSLLFMTNTYKEGTKLELAKNFVVGKDHFAHLFAEIISANKATHIVNVVWKNADEDIIYKKETINVKVHEKELINIYSNLGLTKKVSGQEILPDALGEYLVILEVDGILAGKISYSIVAE